MLIGHYMYLSSQPDAPNDGCMHRHEYYCIGYWWLNIFGSWLLKFYSTAAMKWISSRTSPFEKGWKHPLLGSLAGL